MARLFTCGFEVQRINTTALTTSDGEGAFYSGTPTITTTNARTGAALSVGGTTLQYMRADVTAVLGRTYWCRLYMRRTANPVTNPFVFLEIATSAGNTVAELRIPAATTNIALHTASTATLRATATGAFPNDSAYHKVELSYNIAAAGNSTFQVWADNVSVISGSFDAGNTIWQQFYVGHSSSSSAGNGGLFDDVAINDDQGSSQNGRCGDGRVYHLLPTVLGAGGRGNWVDGAGGTTNLHDALNNTPPTGTAAGAAGTQIENPTSGSSAAEFDTQTYDAVVPTGEDVALVAGMWKTGVNDLTGTGAGTARLFSNPDVGADTTINFEGSTAIAGTDPAGWRTEKSAYVYNPVLTRSAVAKLRITKAELTTRVHSCDYMAVQVETMPRSPLAGQRRSARYAAPAPGRFN